MPLVSDDRVIAVISVATIDDHRAFSPDDLAVMQTLASEATIALERTRAAHRPRRGAAARASAGVDRAPPARGARPRRRARSGRRRDGACARGRALLRPARRLGGRAPRGRAVDGAEGVAAARRRHARTSRCRISQRAKGEPSRSPTSRASPELAEPRLGDLGHLRSLGARAVASTPIVVQGRADRRPRRCIAPSRAPGAGESSRCSKRWPPSAGSRFGSAGCSRRTASGSASRRRCCAPRRS